MVMGQAGYISYVNTGFGGISHLRNQKLEVCGDEFSACNYTYSVDSGLVQNTPDRENVHHITKMKFKKNYLKI